MSQTIDSDSCPQPSTSSLQQPPSAIMTATVEEVTEHSFDYIICGGGTAGLTLAARLSEDPDITVLVLEAGQANLNDPVILRPGSYGVHFANPNYAWPYQTSKQTGLLGLEPWWFRGKGLGGTSGINFMVWTKPPAEEINDWERLGNPGWNWGNYVTYLNRSEGFVPPSPEVQQRLHMKLGDWSLGKDGPVKVSFPGTINEVELTVMETLKNFGIHEAPLPLDGNPNGSFLVPNNYDPITHTRSYAATAHYLPNQNRRNLTVLVSAHVSRVITERASDGPHAATGVEFYYEDKPLIAHARKEVIVSAGALKSPHILELSGIGDKSLLHKIGIPVKIDLPGVGNNVQEHILGLMSWELRDDVDFQSLDILRDLGEAERQIELHADGKGVHTLGVVGLSFSPLRKITAKADAIISAAKARILEQADTYPPGRLEQFKIHLERLENDAPMCEIITFSGFMSGPNPPEPGKKYLSIFASLNQCWSRGTIHATSNDPQQEPEFDPHYFEEEIDKQLWFELIKFTRNLGKTAPLKDLIGTGRLHMTISETRITFEQLKRPTLASMSSMTMTSGNGHRKSLVRRGTRPARARCSPATKVAWLTTNSRFMGRVISVLLTSRSFHFISKLILRRRFMPLRSKPRISSRANFEDEGKGAG